MLRSCTHFDDGVVWCYAKYFSGTGTDYALVCPACRAFPETIEANLVAISPERFARIEENGDWEEGSADENLIPAALIFDAESGQLIRWFAGPVGAFAFNRYLFSFSPDAGTSAWDVATGERVLHDASFCPTTYHPGAGQFVTVTTGGEFRLSRLVGV